VVPEIPRTLKRIFQGTPVAEALNVDSMANPDSIKPILELAARSIGGAQ
jgi:hypothetical protein